MRRKKAAVVAVVVVVAAAAAASAAVVVAFVNAVVAAAAVCLAFSWLITSLFPTRAYEPDYVHENLPGYCDELTYKFAFHLAFITLGMVVIAIIVLGCGFCIFAFLVISQFGSGCTLG